MTRKVYIEPAWKNPLSTNYLVNFPPDGYEFVTTERLEERMSSALSRSVWPYRLLWVADRVIPTILFRAMTQTLRKPPPGTALTYCTPGHLVFRREPWIVEVDYCHALIGMYAHHLRLFKPFLERMLASPYCRGIKVWAEAGRRSMLARLNCDKFEHKIEVIHTAVPAKEFVKEYGTGKVRLLFVGSGNMAGGSFSFEAKGGRETLEAFVQLRQRYSNIELIIRSGLPPDVKRRYSGMEGVSFLDGVLPWKELERLYLSADVLVVPSPNAPVLTVLDAMSYEIPPVILDSFSNPDHVENGRTGLLVETPRHYPFVWGPDVEVYRAADHNPCRAVVEGLVRGLGTLIENTELRRSMGRAARWEVEHGKFSLAARNANLKRMFDNAIEGYAEWVASSKGKSPSRESSPLSQAKE